MHPHCTTLPANIVKSRRQQSHAKWIDENQIACINIHHSPGRSNLPAGSNRIFR